MKPEDETNEVYRFFTEVGIINQLISTKLEAFLPGRMTATQFGILGHLVRRPEGETPLQLSNAFQVPKTSMTHMLSSLENHALITLEANPNDKRSKIVRSTPQGAEFLEACMERISEALVPILFQLGLDPFHNSLPNLTLIREALDSERD
ncbi:MarR family transcriptional regulator [Ruegeria sp. AD91A]|uniref:MarR family winged helix-turn-helix transcriptional regulator n=1 Tax=Ruegeria sp. AD91A TaxID=2293862 RepID=UPI000E53CAD5|nr:MarR family transcriptional regulator [Ruegeria sp. AD91A]AXT27487.1 MarR family transcriptional regulator [Ruegeria sp. AD91A]